MERDEEDEIRKYQTQMERQLREEEERIEEENKKIIQDHTEILEESRMEQIKILKQTAEVQMQQMRKDHEQSKINK